MAARRVLLARLLPPGWLAAPSQLPLLGCGAAELSLSSGSVHTARSTAASRSSGSCDTSSGSGGSSQSSGSWGGRDLQPLPSSSGCALSLAARRGYSASAVVGAAAAAGAVGTEEPSAPPALDELPLWRFLEQHGFSADSISRIHRRASIRAGKDGQLGTVVGTTAVTPAKLQRDVAPKLAALGAEGLDTATIEQLFVRYPQLLTTPCTTFNSALAALRQLAALLPDDPRTVQAPPGATQLGVALWLYPSAAARLLARANLGSLIESNLQLRRQLGVSDAATAVALFQQQSVLVSNFERAEAMVAHLQRLRASGELSQEQVAKVATSPGALHLAPAKFDQIWQEGGLEALRSITYTDPAGRKQAAAEALGELLQAADGVPGALQPQYQQQGDALVKRNLTLARAGPAALQGAWDSLQQFGLSSSQIVAVMHKQPALLGYNWEDGAKQRLLAWVQQELGLSPFDFLLHHGGYATYSVARVAMRAAFVRQHRPSVWQEVAARGTAPLLSLLTQKRFFDRAGCTQSDLAAFNRTWLTTAEGRRWGAKPSVDQLRTSKLLDALR